MVEIIPSILSNDPKELAELIGRSEGKVDRVHIDIIDGKFADNKTIDPSALEEIDTNLRLDYHLMVKEPINWVERCARGQADRIIAQIEMMTNQVDYVGKVQEVGAKIGLGIDLNTPVSKLDPVILTNLEVVLVMSVKAGFGGQAFDKKTIDKIGKLEEIRGRDDTPFRICVDGGINEKTVRGVVKAQADEVSMGRLLFKGDLGDNVKRIKKAAYEKN